MAELLSPVPESDRVLPAVVPVEVALPLPLPLELLDGLLFDDSPEIGLSFVVPGLLVDGLG